MISAICNKNELLFQYMGRLAYVGCVECASNKPRHTPSGVQTAVQKLARCFSRDKNFVLMGKEIWRLKLSRGRYSHTEQTFMLGVWSNLPRELHLRNAKKPLTPRTFGVLEESGVVHISCHGVCLPLCSGAPAHMMVGALIPFYGTPTAIHGHTNCSHMVLH